MRVRLPPPSQSIQFHGAWRNWLTQAAKGPKGGGLGARTRGQKSPKLLATTGSNPAVSPHERKIMTDAEWQKEARKLKGAITRARNKALAAKTQASVAEENAKALLAENALELHKRNYWELVKSL